MKTVAITTFLLVVMISAFAQSDAEKLTWHSDVKKAYEMSRETNRPIFAFFTGSDWCGWCHKLQREVFAKPEFADWAEDNVVLLELDFPRRKELPVEVVQQNQALQQFFQVTGFPTIWIFNMAQDDASKKFVISAFGSLGYPAGATNGKEEVKFLENANAVLAKK